MARLSRASDRLDGGGTMSGSVRGRGCICATSTSKEDDGGEQCASGVASHTPVVRSSDLASRHFLPTPSAPTIVLRLGHHTHTSSNNARTRADIVSPQSADAARQGDHANISSRIAARSIPGEAQPGARASRSGAARTFLIPAGRADRRSGTAEVASRSVWGSDKTFGVQTLRVLAATHHEILTTDIFAPTTRRDEGASVLNQAHATSVEASSRDVVGHAQTARAHARHDEMHARRVERAMRSVNGRAEHAEAHAAHVLARPMLLTGQATHSRVRVAAVTTSAALTSAGGCPAACGARR
jgi:hypothetical protein